MVKYKNILITGATSGIGEALALYYAVPKGEEEGVRGEMVRVKREKYDEFAKRVSALSKRAEYEIVVTEEE